MAYRISLSDQFQVLDIQMIIHLYWITELELIVAKNLNHDLITDLIILCERYQWQIHADFQQVMITPFQFDTDHAFSLIQTELPQLIYCDIGFETKS